MTEIISLIDLLRVQSKAYCDKHAITYFSDGESESDFRTFSGLMDRSQKIGSFLLQHHQPGDVILLPFASSLEFVDAFFGVLYAGMIGVPAPAIRLKRVDSRFKGLMEDAKPAAILQATAQQAKNISELYADDNILAYSLEDILKEDIEIKAAVHNELAYLQYTSGSTSTPKGVMISQKNVLENCRMIGRYVSIKTEDKVVTWLPHFHDMGLVGGIIVPIFFGMTMYMFPPACFIQKPKRWLSLISKYKATISVAPNFAYDLCEKKISYQDLEGVDLSSWRAALNGAEPIMAATVRAFFEKFGPFGLRSSIMCGSYGMAEATLAVTIQAPGKNSYFTFDQAELTNGKLVKPGFNEKPDLLQEKILISCGQPDKAIDIKIVDPVTLNLCEPGEVGEIWIRGNSVAQGYWCNPDATRQAFEANINEDGLTYLRTGDYGGLFDNELFITGRMKDVLIVNGRNYYPQDIELHCRKSDLLVTHSKSIVFQSNNGDLVFLQEVSDIKNTNYSELSEFIAAIIFDEFELIIKEIIFVFHKTLPHTTSGKIQREKCRLMYESDDFKYLAREFPGRVYAQLKNKVNYKEKIPFVRPRDAIEFKLIEIAKTVLGIDNVGVSDNLMDFGFESVRVVEFIEALNNQFNKTFPLSVIIENPSLEKIALLIRNESANSLESQIVLLRKGSSNKCVFCIHTIGGNPYIYYELSAQLSPEYAVFGIQAKGLEEGEEPLQTIEEMGKLYANQILEISPDGPVLIIGYSSAAIIAYELANQLQRERRRKALLLFIDPLSPTAIRETRSVDDVELQFRATLGEALIKSEDDWIEYWESHRQEIAAIKTDQERLIFLENQLSLAPAVFFPDFGEKRLRRFLSTYMSIYKALWCYSPQYIFRGKIHMLRIPTKTGEINKVEEDKFLGWRKNVTDGVVIEFVSGEHLSVLSEPTVSIVSNIINRWISESFAH